MIGKNHITSGRMKISIVILFVTVMMVGCQEKPTREMFVVEEDRLLDSIPSASGIAVEGDSAWIVGDDATRMYRISLTSYQQRSMPLRGFAPGQYREPKPVKHDLESAALVQWKSVSY